MLYVEYCDIYGDFLCFIYLGGRSSVCGDTGVVLDRWREEEMSHKTVCISNPYLRSWALSSDGKVLDTNYQNEIPPESGGASPWRKGEELRELQSLGLKRDYTPLDGLGGVAGEKVAWNTLLTLLPAWPDLSWAEENRYTDEFSYQIKTIVDVCCI